jgi:hypothetical protein
MLSRRSIVFAAISAMHRADDVPRRPQRSQNFAGWDFKLSADGTTGTNIRLGGQRDDFNFDRVSDNPVPQRRQRAIPGPRR